MTKPVKTVCVVGGGPAGLVAAKTLLHNPPNGANYDVTIFDSQCRIGGLWPANKADDAGLVHPAMIANQSKHTMCFSDFSWPDTAPQIPRAFQVGEYLELYRQRYCQEVTLRLECKVENADLIPYLPDESEHYWQVRTWSKEKGSEEHRFDYLVVASGYFGEPALPGLPEDTENAIPVVHSSKYRNLEQLLGGLKGKSGKILVVGGQFSGVEIAATIATHLSDAMNAPGPLRDDYIDQKTQGPRFSVHHLIQRPTWILPLVTASTPADLAPCFLPMDLNSQNLSNRPPGPLVNTQGHISVERAKLVNSFFRGLLKTDQSEFSPKLAVQESDYDNQPFVGISDTYMDHVRSGAIGISQGKLKSLSGNIANVTPSEEKINDVAAVILATGFKASTSLSFLPGNIQEKLAVAPNDLNNTVALAFHNTHHPAVPNLGFVGFYRAPYWGAVEMQARFVTALFSYGGPLSHSLPASMAESLKNDTSIKRTLALRTDPRASQFPMGDYAWLSQEFGTALDIARIPPLGKMPVLSTNNREMNILTAARYPGNGLDRAQNAEVVKNLTRTEELVQAGMTKGRFVARAVFRSLLGDWKLDRKVESQRPEQPTGRFVGTASFHLRNGTSHGREEEFANIEREGGDQGYEYLYIENGEFIDETKRLRFNATRRYIWRYNEAKDKLSVWFNRIDEDRTADYLFHEIDFILPNEGEDRVGGWKATGSHLCIEDVYNVQYEFSFDSVNLREWKLGYSVNGPKKNYRLDATYKR
ncbi:hypothetical protein TWF730_007298 [Orbilia blumenaviensis]|uniref:DUF6314 domain-containing protein n=1 Tax=Orbilia blumenaviensis TaxID=1796055 RepID=A0AAV9V7M9_9PEZI